MREPNSIDFWRGVALVMIFIDHIPGNIWSNFTLRNYALCDAAELFVFLAGWSLALATGTAVRPDPLPRVLFRLTSRSIEVYRAQIVITAIALAILAAGALLSDDPAFLEWHNAGPVFFDPVPTLLGMVGLVHHLGFFDILPLYVALLMMANLFVPLARWRPGFAAGFSLGLYLAALVFRLNFPTWPVQGTWFFDPLTWQVLLVSGFLLGDAFSRNRKLWERLRKWRAPAAAIAALGAYAALRGIHPDPLHVPEPRLLFMFEKTYLSPARLVNFFALLMLFQGVFEFVRRHTRAWVALLSALGRNSLAVFCVGSITSLIAQIVRFLMGGGIVIDTASVAVGFASLVVTAWFVEWRARSPRFSQPLPS